MLWRRWEDNIKTDPRNMEWGRGVHSIDLKDRNKWQAVANKVMNIRV